MSYWMSVRRRLAAAALAAVDIATLAIAYTGNMTDEIVTMGDGKQYRLLTRIRSGTLSIAQEVKADVWLCGGGARGENGSKSGGGRGGSGGFIAQTQQQSVENIVCVVGAGNSGASSVSGDVTLNANGAVYPIPWGYNSAAGSSGGGGGADYNVSGLIGSGVSTYPFNDTTYFNGRPHCPGGGGGAYRDESGTNIEYATGGSGGSNGSNGGTGQYSDQYNNASAAPGGLFGGGNGGADPAYSSSGSKAGSFYGAGGGGGSGRDTSFKNGANGYQGVIYVRIPLNQKEAA